jgi:D-lyxose ketol-isomerase
MKRSEINSLIDGAIGLLNEHNVKLPPFAYWSAQDWTKKGSECDEIRACRLGWDITDFGSGRFNDVGLVVFTSRNGDHKLKPYAGKPYAEKVLIIQENQYTPMHCHRMKSEDIICRSGGNLLIKLYNRTDDGRLADTDVDVTLDGVRYRVKAGHVFRLEPGASITLTPLLLHTFWAEEGKGTAIVGEVSSVNDDETDNFFYEKIGRFPQIEEDVPARYKLCTEY